MADSVLAVQQGFEFQAKYFWYKACKLYIKNSNVVNIGWEISNVPGFDDVALYYQPAKLSKYGYEVRREFYQLKFHVSHNSAFSCQALTQSDFIGATSESLLHKLYRNFQKSQSEYENSVYHIVNTWGLDRSDILTTLIDNAGAIILDRLFDGTTDRSKNGKIRKLWRDHLGTTDEVLRTVLRQLRIIHNAKSGEYIDEDVNFALNSVGLLPFTSDKRTNSYADLIRRLHEEKRNLLNGEELREILSTENLWVTNTTSEVRSNYRIGVRTFRKGTDTIEFETDEYLSLLHHFDGRYILEQSLWPIEIAPALQGLAERALSKGKPVVIHLDTHISAAFTMGYLMDNKTGLDIGVVQKLRNGSRLIFKPDNAVPPGQEPQWGFSEAEINADGSNTTIAFCVTHDISSDVKEYVQKELPDTSRILFAKINPKPSGTAIRDGNHIIQAIEEFIVHFRSWRTSQEKSGTVHLFLAAPNAFAFFLGRYSRILGKMLLYEFDFENLRTGSYIPSISLPF